MGSKIDDDGTTGGVCVCLWGFRVRVCGSTAWIFHFEFIIVVGRCCCWVCYTYIFIIELKLAKNKNTNLLPVTMGNFRPNHQSTLVYVHFGITTNFKSVSPFARFFICLFLHDCVWCASLLLLRRRLSCSGGACGGRCRRRDIFASYMPRTLSLPYTAVAVVNLLRQLMIVNLSPEIFIFIYYYFFVRCFVFVCCLCFQVGPAIVESRVCVTRVTRVLTLYFRIIFSHCLYEHTRHACVCFAKIHIRRTGVCVCVWMRIG